MTIRPKYYIPRNPYPTPPHYPQAPLGVLSTAGLFGQLDVETLFYVFYYLPGTYQQYVPTFLGPSSMADFSGRTDILPLKS
jgi:CCR4-NOT transcription complex subunit 3